MDSAFVKSNKIIDNICLSIYVWCGVVVGRIYYLIGKRIEHMSMSLLWIWWLVYIIVYFVAFFSVLLRISHRLDIIQLNDLAVTSFRKKIEQQNILESRDMFSEFLDWFLAYTEILYTYNNKPKHFRRGASFELRIKLLE